MSVTIRSSLSLSISLTYSVLSPGIRTTPNTHYFISLCGVHELTDLPILDPTALVAIVLHANLEPGKEHDRG